MIQKIISGGQAGADIGGLVGARRAGIKTGGIAPKGWKTEKGPQPVLADYGLVEYRNDNYIARTLQNVIDSDATIIFATNISSDGTQKTIKFAKEHQKPFICINPFNPFALTELKAFCLENNISIVNIAGNRESKCKGITQKVADLIHQLLGEMT